MTNETNRIEDDEIYRLAMLRVEEKKGFIVDLISYIVINTLLVVIWAVTWRGYPWFIWPMMGWGVGVVFHFLGVFVFNHPTGWEKRELEKEMDKLRRIRQSIQDKSR